MPNNKICSFNGFTISFKKHTYTFLLFCLLAIMRNWYCAQMRAHLVYKSINVLLLIRNPVGVTFIITRTTPGREGDINYIFVLVPKS